MPVTAWSGISQMRKKPRMWSMRNRRRQAHSGKNPSWGLESSRWRLQIRMIVVGHHDETAFPPRETLAFHRLPVVAVIE